MTINDLRKEYHRDLIQQVIRFGEKKGVIFPNFADGDSKASVCFAKGIVKRIGCNTENTENISGQTTGDLFESITRLFLEKSFNLLQHIRPGSWLYHMQSPISNYDQYEHLAYLDEIIKKDKTLASTLRGDYIIKPDIILSRLPLLDNEINVHKKVIVGNEIATLNPLRKENNNEQSKQILMASISCKWTIRSDRSQNTRTEALNLIRNRKGNLPHIMAVTAEPLPTRIAAIALGTGDLDCTYHFALNELIESVKESENEDQLDMLNMMVDGRRLRDISDLPFDLAI